MIFTNVNMHIVTLQEIARNGVFKVSFKTIQLLQNLCME